MAHSVDKCRRFLERVYEVALDSGSDKAVVRTAEQMADARDTLNLLRRCQPGIPEPHSLTSNPGIQSVIKNARAQMREVLDNSTKLQVVNGSTVLTRDEQRTLLQACDNIASVDGMCMRVIIKVGVATGQRPDDIARRKWCLVALERTQALTPQTATAVSFSGKVSKSTAGKLKHWPMLRNKDVIECPQGSLAEWIILLQNKPLLQLTLLDELGAGQDSFRNLRVIFPDRTWSTQRTAEEQAKRVRSLYDQFVSKHALDVVSEKSKGASIFRTTMVARLSEYGCPDSAIKALGNWSPGDTMARAYQNKHALAALQVMTIMAGHGTLESARTNH